MQRTRGRTMKRGLEVRIIPEHIRITEEGDSSGMTWPNVNTTRWKNLLFRMNNVLHTDGKEMTITREEILALRSAIDGYVAAVSLTDDAVRRRLAYVINGRTQKSEGFDDPDE